MVVEDLDRDPNDEVEALPEQVHGYRVLGRLGRGGFADVYLACPKGSFRLVALKVLRADVDKRVREQVVSRFHTEENIARAVNHPAIVDILGTSAPEVTPAYIAMEYVDGLPFCEHFRQADEPPKLHEVARLGHEVAAAMAEAHQKGIVHRDLKPDNVLVTKGSHGSDRPRVKILDFGIAKAPLELFSSASDHAVTRYVTELGTVMGSPPFMAPEQNGAAHAVTGKADVFALGMMLLIVVGRLDEGELFGAQLMLTQSDTMKQWLARCPDLPPGWVDLFSDMLALDHQKRIAMTEAARRLQRLARSNDAFARAVEAWLTRKKVPSARRLKQFLTWAQSADDLTSDEQRFLRLAPAVRLPQARWIAPTVLLLGVTAAAAALAWEGEIMGTPSPSNLPAAPRPSPNLETTTVAVVQPASLVAQECPPLDRSEIVAAQDLLDRCRQGQYQDRTRIKTLGEKLQVAEAALADLEIEAREAQHQVKTLENELERSRETAAEEGKKAFACNQQLESNKRQLDESMRRWRVCAKASRSGDAAESSEPKDNTNDSVTPAKDPPSES